MALLQRTVPWLPLLPSNLCRCTPVLTPLEDWVKRVWTYRLRREASWYRERQRSLETSYGRANGDCLALRVRAHGNPKWNFTNEMGKCREWFLPQKAPAFPAPVPSPDSVHKCSYSPTHHFMDFFQINPFLLTLFFRWISTQLILFWFLILLHFWAKFITLIT